MTYCRIFIKDAIWRKWKNWVFACKQKVECYGNFFLQASDINLSNKDKIVQEIADNAIRYSGSGVFLYGRFDMNPSILQINY